jgi:hypothetical protein
MNLGVLQACVRAWRTHSLPSILLGPDDQAATSRQSRQQLAATTARMQQPNLRAGPARNPRSSQAGPLHPRSRGAHRRRGATMDHRRQTQRLADRRLYATAAAGSDIVPLNADSRGTAIETSSGPTCVDRQVKAGTAQELPSPVD